LTDQVGQLYVHIMARSTPPERIAELIKCAAQVFIEQGYRRTQMADVATALGVAKGTLYLYVESKDALFDLVARYADVAPPFENPPALPVPTPKSGQTFRYVRERLAKNRAPAALLKALKGRPAADSRAELEAIVRELYDMLRANRVGIKLIDSSARDTPELAALWFKGARGGLLELLAQYLTDRFRQKRLRSTPDPAVAARLVLEMLVFWAVHRHWDAAPQAVEEQVAKESAVHFIVSALAKDER
jgi:AcrR family transcriptional regulator